jgi:hypothetical protein
MLSLLIEVWPMDSFSHENLLLMWFNKAGGCKFLLNRLKLLKSFPAIKAVVNGAAKCGAERGF